MSEDVTVNHLLVYVEHLKAVWHDMHAQLKDPLEIEIFPRIIQVFPWIITFQTSIPVSKCDSTEQKLFVNMQSDEKARDFLTKMQGHISRSSALVLFWNCGRR